MTSKSNKIKYNLLRKQKENVFYLHGMRLSAGRLSVSEDGAIVAAEDIWNTWWYIITVKSIQNRLFFIYC